LRTWFGFKAGPRAIDGLLEPLHHIGVEVPLEARAPGVHVREGAQVDDLLCGAPQLAVLAHVVRLPGERHRVVPDGHHLVHAPAVQERTGRPLEVVDEAVDLLVGCGPADIAVHVGDEAVQRGEHGVDQPAHVRAPSPAA
jgi:hypothetical protein